MLSKSTTSPAGRGQRTLAAQIDALLPQTQCGKCGYAGCWPYAGAITRGEADINQCPPGGDAVIKQLAALLGRNPKPLNPAHGVQGQARVAVIDEALCIGCTKCIQACPVDAILGAAKLMHTVIEELCTGCELCLPPCPVDCIELSPASLAWTPERADAARARYLARRERLEAESLSPLDKPNYPQHRPPQKGRPELRAEIQESVRRARERRRRPAGSY